MCRAEARDVFPALRRIDGAMMLMKGEVKSVCLVSGVGECSTTSPVHPSFLPGTNRVSDAGMSVSLHGWTRQKCIWVDGSSRNFPTMPKRTEHFLCVIHCF